MKTVLWNKSNKGFGFEIRIKGGFFPRLLGKIDMNPIILDMNSYCLLFS